RFGPILPTQPIGDQLHIGGLVGWGRRGIQQDRQNQAENRDHRILLLAERSNSAASGLLNPGTRNAVMSRRLQQRLVRLWPPVPCAGFAQSHWLTATPLLRRWCARLLCPNR